MAAVSQDRCVNVYVNGGESVMFLNITDLYFLV